LLFKSAHPLCERTVHSIQVLSGPMAILRSIRLHESVDACQTVTTWQRRLAVPDGSKGHGSA
jgi:hypothetical protein